MEEFRKITGYENYSVSNVGRTRNDKTNRLLNPTINIYGYYYVTLRSNSKSKKYLVHRLVATTFIDNPSTKPFVDHINNDRLNNHVNNLRWATYSENCMNSSIRVDNTSGIKGVIWDKLTKKWRSRININGKETHIGLYNTLEEAQIARRRVAEQNFGDFINDCEKRTIIINNPQVVNINN